MGRTYDFIKYKLKIYFLIALPFFKEFLWEWRGNLKRIGDYEETRNFLGAFTFSIKSTLNWLFEGHQFYTTELTPLSEKAKKLQKWFEEEENAR